MSGPVRNHAAQDKSMASSTEQERQVSPQPGEARTYYKRPWLNRWTGHYTLEWDTAQGVQKLSVHNRLVDLQGKRPSLYSILRLPKTLWTWAQSKRGKLLKSPYPFLVWDAIDYLDRVLMPGFQVLEVGGGNSTLWLLDRGAQVQTIEPNPAWIETLTEAAMNRIGPDLEGRLRLVEAQGNQGINAIDAIAERSLDLVIVDPKGQEISRFDALKAAMSKLKSGGWLVLDNSDHPNNLAAVEFLGPPHKIVTGYGAMCLVVTQTAFWRVVH